MGVLEEQDTYLNRLGRKLGEALLAKGWSVATAESCTGGWIAKVLTDVPGCSQWFGWGFVTYADNAKEKMLHVSKEVLDHYGAVSRETARSMAEGARDATQAQLAMAVTGIAGPEGGSKEKPVGTVWFGWIGPDGFHAECCYFEGDRENIRRESVTHAIKLLLRVVNGSPGGQGD
ncbi:MAG: CinA family protein [Pseudomonadota bacterium]|nr:CinA family protein [Pseudomonadota bacterium]